MKKILVVDDEKAVCSLVKDGLEAVSPYQVIVATNGKEALRAAGRHKLDLILLDIIMPGMDGFEVLKKLKDNMSTVAIPVAMLTSRSDDTAKETASRLYDEEYITKPFALDDLKARIEEVLRRRGK